MAAAIAGRSLGIAPNSVLVPVRTGVHGSGQLYERNLEALLRILDDVIEFPGRPPRAVINMSFRIQPEWVAENPYGVVMGKFNRLAHIFSLLRSLSLMSR
jgi:hypothetical protein